MDSRLYVIVSDTLEPIYSCVQGGHVVAQWLLDHPEQQWNNNYLIYLKGNVEKWSYKLGNLGIDYTSFQEPDLGGQTTALAILENEKLFKHLKLVSL